MEPDTVRTGAGKCRYRQFLLDHFYDGDILSFSDRAPFAIAGRSFFAWKKIESTN